MNLGFFDKALDGLERNMVETLQQAAARTIEFEGEFPTQPQRSRAASAALETSTAIDVAANKNVLTFWENFCSQESMAELREEQNAVRLARDKGITTSAVLQRRLTDVEDAFLRLTASLLGASDPIPLMRSNAGLMHTAKDAQEDVRRLRAELASSHLDNAETDALVELSRKLEAANKQLQEKLGIEVAAAQQLSEETSEAIEALKQRDRLQAMLREAHTSLTALQVEHERSQSRVFELESSREELTAATQLDADLEEEQSQRTHRLLGQLQRERAQLQEQSELLKEQLAAAEARPAAALLPPAHECALQDQIKQLSETLEDEKYAYEAQLSLLQVELRQKSVQSAAADAELATRPSLQEFQRVVERVEMLRSMVDSQMEAEGWEIPTQDLSKLDQQTLQPALQERNRKLAAERSRLQRELESASGRITEAESSLRAAQRQVARQADLIDSLEEDLLSAGTGPRAPHSAEPQSATTASGHESSSSIGVHSGGNGDHEGGRQGNGGDGGVSEGGERSPMEPGVLLRSTLTRSGEEGSLLSIVTAQRDRFHQRALQLEEEAGAAHSEIGSLRRDLAAAQRDNVDMVATLRYLERYSARQGASGNGGSAGGVVIRVDGAGVKQEQRMDHRLSCGPISLAMPTPSRDQGTRVGTARRRALACFGGDDSNEGDEEGGHWPGEQKYNKAYEARLNPFEEFKQSEADRGRAALPAHDRALLSGSKLFLANRVARLFVVAYLVLLHLFVLAMLYYMSSSDATELPMTALEALPTSSTSLPLSEVKPGVAEAIANSVADAAGTLSQAVSSLGKVGASSST